MKTFFVTSLAALAWAGLAFADPQMTSWMTMSSTKYARVYTSDAAKLAGTSVATWTNGRVAQSLPTYVGVQEIAHSAGWVYIKTSGLGAHVMGPWYNNTARTQAFPNLPVNQKAVWRFPRTVTTPASKPRVGLGVIGYFVDGVAVFDGRDGQAWNGTAEGMGGNGSWERDAWINEGVTFDPAYAHQQPQGTYHYHASPVALRHALGDHVDFNATTKTYTESAAAATAHSPILGWLADGSPVYGPFGYSNASSAGSGVRRMISGYQLRNGSNGTDNLTVTGRSAIPAWAARAGFAARTGPAVSAVYPLGRYMQDNAYLGDLGRTLGVDFDLDEHNGRVCVTPEFPAGVYAYFISIEANGTPKFPYIVGRTYHGTPTGGGVTSITEAVTTDFKGGPKRATDGQVTNASAGAGNVTLTWNSVEGGTYTVEQSSDQAAWTTLATAKTAAANAIQTTITQASTSIANFYRAVRTALASYDPVVTTPGAAYYSYANYYLSAIQPYGLGLAYYYYYAGLGLYLDFLDSGDQASANYYLHAYTALYYYHAYTAQGSTGLAHYWYYYELALAAYHWYNLKGDTTTATAWLNYYAYYASYYYSYYGGG